MTVWFIYVLKRTYVYIFLKAGIYVKLLPNIPPLVFRFLIYKHGSLRPAVSVSGEEHGFEVGQCQVQHLSSFFSCVTLGKLFSLARTELLL